MVVKVDPLQPHVNAKTRGCQGNGTTDDLTNFNIAAAAAVSLNLPLYVPPGTYILGVGASIQARVSNGLTIFGAGMGQTILKVKNNAGNYPAVFCPAAGFSGSLSDCTLRDLTIDQNDAGNTTSTIAAGAAATTLAAFSCGIGNRITLDHVEFKEAVGVNTISVNGTGATDLSITNCTGNWVRGASAAEYDNSFIYFNGRRGTFTGNKFRSTITERAICAFEVHGSGVVVADNEIDGFRTVANLVTGVDTITLGQVCTGNVGLNANGGISLWSLTGKTLKGCIVANNHLEINQLDWNENSHWGIVLYQSASVTGTHDGHRIEGNTIAFQTGDTRTVDRFSVALASLSAGLALTPFGDITRLVCSGNTVRDATRYGLWVGQSVTTVITYSDFDDNKLIDIGLNSAAAQRAAIVFQGVITDVRCRRNRISDTGAILNGEYWLIANANLGACTKLEITDNDVWTKSGTALSRSIDATKVTTLWATSTIDYASIAAGATGSNSVTVLGAAVGDNAIVNTRSALAVGLVMLPPIVTAGSVAIPLLNPTAGAIDQGAVVFDVRVIKTGVSTM